MELVYGGVATVVYGDTDSPHEAVFKSFADVWVNINVQVYKTFHTNNRKLNDVKDQLVAFLLNWLENGTNLREDYKKLTELSKLFS